MQDDSQKYLAGDIGGTKTLLAIFSYEGEKLVIEREEKFKNKDFPSIEAITRQFLAGEKVRSSCFGIAGPVQNGVCSMVNLPWVVDSHKIALEFGFEKAFLINDLLANAYGISVLQPKDFFVLQEGEEKEGENEGLISVGTGLGHSALFYYNGEKIPKASEGGHADFAPHNEREIKLLRYLKKQYGHVSSERVLSGNGISSIYQFLKEVEGEKPTESEKELMLGDNPTKIIIDLANRGESELCAKTLDWFCSIYGAAAGNFALMTLALGGIYVGGGIAPKIINYLKKGDFIRAFSDKGRLSDLLSRVPIKIILEEKTALHGAAVYSKKMSNSHGFSGF